MKKLILILLAALPFAVHAQNHQYIVDTATELVDGYLRMMNHRYLPEDSLVVIDTRVTIVGTTDTFVMKRWYAQQQNHRVEVWHQGELQTAFYGNGLDHFRRYVRDGRYWEDVGPALMYRMLGGYDFRGPLFNWRTENLNLEYLGRAKTEDGHSLRVVKVTGHNNFMRYYMFEESGLLTLFLESDTVGTNPIRSATHVDWKCFHEYLPVSHYLFPVQESFLRDGTLTVLESTVHFEPLDLTPFNQD